jgi:GNAT superfamily N-acetyltransferase
VLIRRDDGHEIDTSPERLDLRRVHGWLSTDAYWAKGRPESVMTKAVSNSLCYGVYAPGGSQVGFARAVTDLATFAYLCDVYVAREARGLGLGTWLSAMATDHLLGHGLRRIMLATWDAHGVYEKSGFQTISRPDRWMEIFRDPPPAPLAEGPLDRLTGRGDVAHR